MSAWSASGWWRERGRAAPEVPAAPVLVGGSPKSGTTAIARLLGVATGLEVSSDPFHRLDENGVTFRDDLYEGRLEIGDLMERHPRVFASPIIKDPNFAFFVLPLLDRFPDSPFAFIVRDPRANLRSILNRLGMRGDEDPGSVERRLPDLPPAWRRVLGGRTPAVEGEDYIERMAHRWNLAVDHYAGCEDRLILIRYEDFNRAKEETIADLAARTGLDPVHPLGEEADTQFQPRGDRGVSWRDFFGERNLGRIEEICVSRMTSLGYELRPGSAP